MKGIINSILSIVSITTVILLSSCGGSDPSPQEVKLKKLIAHGWTLSSVTVDGVDKTSLFSGMTLSFTKTNYTTTNGAIVWPSSGTWEFVDSKGTTIIRNDDLEITITEITGTTLKLSLVWSSTTYGPGRATSVAGNHVFSFVED